LPQAGESAIRPIFPQDNYGAHSPTASATTKDKATVDSSDFSDFSAKVVKIWQKYGVLSVKKRKIVC
jgi:hypothetical protein